MVKMPPPGHPLRDTLNVEHVATYCNPAHAPLQEDIKQATKNTLAWMFSDRAIHSANVLCTDPEGHHLLIRVHRDGSHHRLWNFCTGTDYGYFNEEERPADFGEHDADSGI